MGIFHDGKRRNRDHGDREGNRIDYSFLFLCVPDGVDGDYYAAVVEEYETTVEERLFEAELKAFEE